MARPAKGGNRREPLLVQQLRYLPDKGQVHPEQATPCHPFGTRSGDRGHAAAPGRDARRHAGPAQHRRAGLWHIKDWMGRDHFRTRRLANVRSEINLHLLAYNLKRAGVGVGPGSANERNCALASTICLIDARQSEADCGREIFPWGRKGVWDAAVHGCGPKTMVRTPGAGRRTRSPGLDRGGARKAI